VKHADLSSFFNRRIVRLLAVSKQTGL